MIEGTLIINLDPPYVGFISNGKTSSSPKKAYWQNSSQHEIKELLHKLGVLHNDKAWPPEEYLARVPMSLSNDTLHRLGITLD